MGAQAAFKVRFVSNFFLQKAKATDIDISSRDFKLGFSFQMAKSEAKVDDIEHDAKAEEIKEPLGYPPSLREYAESVTTGLKLDPKTKIVLSPQPSDDINDPLNYPSWLKWTILIVVAFAAFQTPFNAAIMIPAFDELAEAYHTSVDHTSYFVAVANICNAWGVRAIFFLKFVVTLVLMDYTLVSRSC
jgi:hypothetical protein